MAIPSRSYCVGTFACNGRSSAPLASHMRSAVAPLLAIACFALAFSGCGERSVPQPVAEDEAMRRATFDGYEVKQAAHRYFYPRKIEDYFAQMDAISEPAQGMESWPDQLLDIKLMSKSQESQELEKTGERPKTEVKPPALTPSEVLGRNTWMIWCGGNEGFWDWLASDNLGFVDFLKLVDSRKRDERFRDAGLINEPGMVSARSASADEFGLWLDVPADEKTRVWRQRFVRTTFAKIAEGLHKSQRGLPQYRGEREAPSNDGGYDYPDAYVASDEPDEYGNSGEYDDDQYEKYKHIPPPDIYGISSGVIGLRLFPNPNFDAKAQREWDPQRYYNDATYYQDPSLVRPYRVGMSCAFCHASFHPLVPPRDTTNPEWRNISGNIGAQYLRMRATVGNLLKPDNFVYHLLDSQPPGTIDTSLIASDNINNPNAMNAIFRLRERAFLQFRNPPETLSRENIKLPSLWRHPEVAELPGDPNTIPSNVRELFAAEGLSEQLRESNKVNPRFTTRILFDGADSIGSWGAFSRVYLNIGSYWERWNQLHQPLVGFEPQRPFTIRDCQKYSVYFNATDLRVGPLRDYFLRISTAMPLLSTEGARKRIESRPKSSESGGSREQIGASETKLRGRRIDVTKLEHGRQVFARNCIVCHSSIQPESSAVTLFSEQGQRNKYEEKYKELIARRNKLRADWADNGEFWDHDPGQWLRDPVYLDWATSIVQERHFWEKNYLSTDYRIPVNVVRTNSARALATNAVAGHMWEDFASLDYKQMPSVGPIRYFNPYAGDRGEEAEFTPRHKVPEGVPQGGGGTGFYRVPTLVSIWNTAPLLHNNSLGLFNNDPSIDGRLDAFDDAIRKLLWPARRLESSSYNCATTDRLKADRGLIWRTTQDSYLTIDGKYVPHVLAPYLTRLGVQLPWMKRVYPLSLPSILLFLGGFALLLARRRTQRRWLGYLTLLLALILVAAWYITQWFPGHAWTDGLMAVEPVSFLLALLVLIGLFFLLPLSWKWSRRSGYGLLALALLVGAFVYFSAGRLGSVTLGPIPKGTPVNLLANVNSEAGDPALLQAFSSVASALAEIESRHLESAEAEKIMRKQIAPELMNISKCPDFVMDKGHYFEWFKTMTDDDKNALIELLKTF